jgi:hypothetical protein
MDNRAAHKVAGVRPLIDATGARQLLRSAKARTADALENAIAKALAAITAENALAWFSHCGYGLR